MTPAKKRTANRTRRSPGRSADLAPAARPARRAAAAPVVPGRREHRKSVTRRELLEAGRRLFGEQGLYDCRIEDLTRHAGIAKGTLYGYFANKEELMAAVVSAGFSELLGHAHRAAQGARSYPELVTSVARAHLEFFDANPDLLRIFHQVRGLLKYGRSESRALRPAMSAFLKGLSQVLSLPAAGTRRDPDRALQSAGVLFGAATGLISTRVAMPETLPRPANHDATVRSLVALVLAHEGRSSG